MAGLYEGKRKHEMAIVVSPEDNRLLIARPDARHILGGIGETKLWELEKAKEIEVVRIGRRTFVTAESLRSFVERLRAVDANTGVESADAIGGS